MNTSPKNSAARLLRSASLLPAIGAGVALHAAEAAPAETKPELAQSAPASAKSAAGSKTERMEKVVVASRREENLADVSPSVSVVTRDEIEARRLLTVGEALQSMPGTFVANASAPQGSNLSLFTRGTESNHTAVLLDGRRLSPGLDNSQELARYTLSGLESVEMQRGATSTLYGANALGGVVNMRTRDTLALASPTGFAEAEAGSFSSARAAISAAGAGALADKEGARRDVGASVSGNLGYTDGTRDNEDFRGNNAVGRIEYSPVKAVVFETLGQVHDQEYGIPMSFGTPSPLQRQKASGWLLSPGVRFDNGDDFSGHVFYSRSESTLFNTNPTAWGPNLSDLYTALDEVSVQVDYKPARWVVFSTGYSYDRTEFARTSTFGNNALAWESHSAWERVTLTSRDKATRLGAGVRRQWFDDFRDKTTGEAFASHKFEETGTSLHAKVAGAYATPTAQDYFWTPPAGELKPEQVRSWEGGARQVFLRKSAPLELGVVYFENNMSDLIAAHEVPPGSWNYQAFNIAEAKSRGVELTAEWRPVTELKVYANATLQDARAVSDDIPNNVRSGDKLARRPDYVTTFGVEVYPVESLTLGVSGTGVMRREDTGHRDMGDYFVARAYGSWRFTRHFEVFGRVENIFDENYDASGIGYDGLPLAAYAGLRARF